MRSVKLVLGLGNPGRQFENTRHNFGAIVLDRAVKDRGLKLIPSLRSHSLLAEDRDGLDVVAFAFPQTFMNNSGNALAGLSKRYKLKETSDLIVIHDELDLPPGSIKVKRGGGVAGHNGLKSIVAQLGSSDFVRIRVGIGRPIGTQPVRDYVLTQLKPSDLAGYEGAFELGVAALQNVLGKGVDAAMNEINRN
ncbi:aminoacyl-tRNA hydrolase [Acidithrix ferrooxidans]|uniref:Peptidyl-tRNA hydrolase n=1 Tax=Acidithrix ferrooxidans TaxID=1280514 RepID=A0A0D8HKW6_9ACTN|nr:aminoacyl-tRNA hydrolase [Acidithrix ferrooxidans]KJF17716.1 peptidyl-tRNA hydrolase [Acidithrix ferrooxidans]